MYSFDWAGPFRLFLDRTSRGATWRRVAPNVWFIGVTSLLTDISSEMVASILPLYLVVHLGMSPFMFGLIDGLYPGVTALVRWVSGLWGDRSGRHKVLAAAGYAVSAVSRLAWLVAGASPSAIAATVTADRLGKGIRTAPRDALISLSTVPADLGASFGVHRAMDAAGAMAGPLTAVLLLALVPRRFDLVFVVSAGFGAVGLAVLLLFVRNVDTAATLRRSRPSLGRQIAALTHHRRLWRTLLASAVLAALTISDAFVYLVLQRHGQVDATRLPLLFVGTSTVYLLLAVPFGQLADRIPRWQVYLGGHVLLVLLYGVLLMPWLSTAGVLIVLLLLGSYYAATDGVLSALASAVLPQDLRGSGLGLVATATNLAKLVASVAFGWLWNAYGTTAALMLFAALLAAGVVASAWVLRRAEQAIMPA